MAPISSLTLLSFLFILLPFSLSSDPTITDLEHNVCDSKGCLERCPRKIGVENFDLDKYVGLWYELARSPNMNEAGTSCNADIYSRKPEEKVVSIYSMTSIKLATGHRFSLLTVGRIQDSERPGFFTAELENGKYVGEATVMYADYDNYLIYYYCLPPPDAKSAQDIAPMVSVFGRKSQLSEEIWTDIREKIEKMGASFKNLEMVDHSDC